MMFSSYDDDFFQLYELQQQCQLNHKLDDIQLKILKIVKPYYVHVQQCKLMCKLQMFIT